MIPKVKALPYILPSVSTVNAGNEQNIATAPYTRKAPYQYGWDWGPRYVTMGVWKPVWLEGWDSARIENFHIHQLKVTGDTAELAAELEIESEPFGTATVTISHDNATGDPLTTAATQTVQLGQRHNHISIPLRIASPKLWYPAGYGAQDRYRFSASVKIGKAVVANAEVKTGLAFGRTSSRTRSVGQEFYLRRERNSGFRQGSERHSLRQLSQPCYRRSAIARSCRLHATRT